MNPAHRQQQHRVRLDWGPTGAVALEADVAVVVDVLSFTTTLTVALERGITVLPYRWRDGSAARFAEEHDAVLAVGRLEAREQHGTASSSAGPSVSLSPAAMAAVEGVRRVVLPSPNGSTICAALDARGSRVVAASLRNASAVAAWLAPQLARGASVAVVPAGERWPDDSLRPAIEDLWGAGAVLAALPRDLDLSPEAALARSAYDAVAGDLPAALAACASGRELVEAGFADDVTVAAGLDASTVVPVLDGGAFHP